MSRMSKSRDVIRSKNRADRSGCLPAYPNASGFAPFYFHGFRGLPLDRMRYRQAAMEALLEAQYCFTN